MIADFVRAGNDAGNIGFMASLRRLNVLLSRQQIGLVILADHRSVNFDLTKDKEPVLEETWDRVTDRNKHMTRVMSLLFKAGRLVNLKDDWVYHRLVKLPPKSAHKATPQPNTWAWTEDKDEEGDEEGGFATEDAAEETADVTAETQTDFASTPSRLDLYRAVAQDHAPLIDGSGKAW